MLKGTIKIWIKKHLNALENLQPTSLDDLKDELADVLVYVAYLCDKYNLDMDEIVNNKMTKNEKKYPAEKCYGKSTKYNKL